MKQELRTAVYDEGLQLEACRFEGIVQPFPNHFHGHYVIGFVEHGERTMLCKNREHLLRPGSIVLFNPGDSHTCTQSDGGTFSYCGLNIPQPTMLALAEEVTGTRALPGFAQNVLTDDELLSLLRPLHAMILHSTEDMGREELLLLLIAALLRRCGQPFSLCAPECPQEVEAACAFIQQHFSEHITLKQICRCAGLSKSTLLRAFARTKGITPYRYLEAIRINAAKSLLAQGVPPLDAALQTGFSDQSHFTNYFSNFIGLAPGLYRDIFSDTNKEDRPHEP